ncbi:TonB-dependent receptor plug domain-containing protein [Albibacterium bauzanense]|uniref:Iron complex outermembrane receptor protein n=1 Tax=Albibacterium bauzanense TaxID=653929 RepID=A0A4R1LX78_9SPHI|nr:TonB-dependent receptor [Albibacterium bauzanense]TCK83512.1 iron complex outermembrane receptor protein [Albibacterium bauzanense]
MKKIIVILGVIIALPAFAQQKDLFPNRENSSSELEEVIIQGNRIQIPFSQTTRDIQIITQKQIEQFPAKSINEVLSYVSGVDIRQRGPFGTQADISIDGGTSEQTLVLINGVKMIDSQSAHNMMNIPIPLSAIDHIEVLRGAAARVYGINALTGAINIVTKREKYSSIIADIQTSSSFKNKEENDGSGIYGGGSAEFTGNFGTEQQSHLFSIAQSNYNGQRYNSKSKNTRLFYNGNYNFDANNSIQAMAGYARSHFGANGFYAAPGDINSEELVESSMFSLSSKHQWNNFTISPRISDRYSEDDYRYFKDDLSKGRSLHYTNALMLELNSTLETRIGTFGFGGESRLEKINSSNIGEHNQDNHGVYAELETTLGKKIKGIAGFYANYNTNYGWQLYPGIDLAYLINDYWKISTSIGSGQRIPSFTDLYLNQAPGNVGNEFLKSENAWNYEGNIQYNKANLNFQTGYFFRNITNFIDWMREDPSQPYSPINLKSNKMQGIHARISQNFDLGNKQSLGYHVSYNYLHPTVKTLKGTQSKYALESLRHQFITGVNYTINNLTFQIENRLLKRELGKLYSIADIRINYQVKKLLLYTNVTNLFDAEYKEAGAVPMPTRWFSLGIKYGWKQL